MIILIDVIFLCLKTIMIDKNTIVEDAKKNGGLTKENKIIARQEIKKQINLNIKQIQDLRKMSRDELAVFFKKPNYTIRDGLYLKKCKNDKIAELEKELDVLEKDDQLLARCPTLPPMLWNTNKNHTDKEKCEIMNKYIKK